MFIPAALSEEDLYGSPSLQALKKGKQQLTKETITAAVLPQVCRLQATSGSSLVSDAKVIAINRLHHHCLHVEDVGELADDDGEDGATEAPDVYAGSVDDEDGDGVAEAPDVQTGYSVAMDNDVASVKATVNEIKKTLDDFKQSTEKSLQEINDTLKALNEQNVTLMQDWEINAQRSANDLRSSTETSWDVVTRRFPKADRPLVETIASTSQLLALSAEEIAEHLEQHTGVNYAGIPMQDLRMRLAHELGVNLTIFKAEVGKLALKRKFVEDDDGAVGMDQ